MNGGEFLRAGKRLVQYVWDPPPKNEDESPIWCLGQRYESHPNIARPDGETAATSTISSYLSTGQSPPQSNSTPSTHTTQSEDDSKHPTAPDGTATQHPPTNTQVDTAHQYESFEKIDAQDEGVDNGWPAAFLDDVETKIWLTYRQDFATIPTSTDPKPTSGMSFTTRLKMLGNKTGFNSDTGWGCMIRSGQSLLANTLAILELGRDWRKGQSPEAEAKLLSLFADDPEAPFSIHRFVQHGASACGKHPGEWFGPSATARCIQALTSSQLTPTDLRVYVRPDDSDVYEDAFLRTAKPTPDSPFHPTLILLGTRLGIDRVTPAYWASLSTALSLPQSVGIAGGRPSSSHYFVGVQASRYFYLDPHFTRPKLPLQPEESDVASCHTRRLRWLHVTQMDPSMLLGFLIRSEEDWRSWRREVTKRRDSHDGVRSSAVVHVHDREPGYQSGEGERAGAVDEVQSCDEGMEGEGEEDGDTVIC